MGYDFFFVIFPKLAVKLMKERISRGKMLICGNREAILMSAMGRERREYKRYRVKNGFFAMDSTRFGRIIDISMGGLSFTCLRQEDWDPVSQGTGHIFGNDNLCLDKVLFRLRSRKSDSNNIPQSAIKMQRLSLEFVGIDRDQEVRIKNFIINNCEGEA